MNSFDTLISFSENKVKIKAHQTTLIVQFRKCYKYFITLNFHFATKKRKERIGYKLEILNCRSNLITTLVVINADKMMLKSSMGNLRPGQS